MPLPFNVTTHQTEGISIARIPSRDFNYLPSRLQHNSNKIRENGRHWTDTRGNRVIHDGRGNSSAAKPSCILGRHPLDAQPKSEVRRPSIRGMVWRVRHFHLLDLHLLKGQAESAIATRENTSVTSAVNSCIWWHSGHQTLALMNTGLSATGFNR
jgi:hypothetical protein